MAISYTMGELLCGFTPEFQIENRLAELIEPNTDATEWTVRLKPDLVFQNGKSITSDDVVYTFRRMLDPKNPMGGASALLGLTYDGISKMDARTVRFTLEQPNAVFPEGLANHFGKIVPVDFDEMNPVGAGPFKLKSFSPGQQIVFEAFPDFWRGAPFLDGVTLIEFNDATARVNALLGGTVDAITQLPGAQMKIGGGQSWIQGAEFPDRRLGANLHACGCETL